MVWVQTQAVYEHDFPIKVVFWEYVRVSLVFEKFESFLKPSAFVRFFGLYHLEDYESFCCFHLTLEVVYKIAAAFAYFQRKVFSFIINTLK